MILKIKHIAAFFVAVGFSSLIVSAQTLPSLMLNQDPVAVSKGMSGVASDAGAFALQNNVAAIALSENSLDAQAGFALWQPSYAKLMTFGGAATYRFGKLGLGLDFKKLNMPSYSSVSGSGADIRDSEFTPGEMNLSAGASYAFIDCLSAGLTLRFADSRLAEEAKAAVFGADVAVYFKKHGISAGLSVNNIGSKVKYSNTSYSQPMMAKLGAGYDLSLGSSALAFAAEADVIFAGGVMAGLGCEYSFKDIVYARAGYHYGNSVNVIPSYASAGLGFKIFGAQLNVAYLFGSAVLSNSMNVSVGYSF